MLYFIPRGYPNLDPHIFGIMCNLLNNQRGPYDQIKSGYRWCMDNGVYSGKFEPRLFFSTLQKLVPYQERCAFVVAPDVMFDWRATNRAFEDFAPKIRNLGFPVAYAVQDGLPGLPPASSYDVLFIGGTTKWKVSYSTMQLMIEARHLGKWVHMARVNSRDRIAYCRELGIDSVDGTHVIYEPDRAFQRLQTWMTMPMLFGEDR